MSNFDSKNKNVVMNKFGDILDPEQIPSKPAPPKPEPKPDPKPEPKPAPPSTPMY